MGIQNKRYAVVNLSSIAFNVYAKRVSSQIHAGGTTAGGEVIGKIYPNEFYIVIPNESPYITSFRIYFRDKNFQGRYGYIETSKGTTLDDYAWNAHQHPYHYYNSSGDALVESKKSASINGTIYRVFKTARNVSCFSPDKTKHITIPAGIAYILNGTSCNKKRESKFPQTAGKVLLRMGFFRLSKRTCNFVFMSFLRIRPRFRLIRTGASMLNFLQSTIELLMHSAS